MTSNARPDNFLLRIVLFSLSVTCTAKHYFLTVRVRTCFCWVECHFNFGVKFFKIGDWPLNQSPHPFISGFSSGPLSLSVRYPMCKKTLTKSHPNSELPFLRVIFKNVYSLKRLFNSIPSLHRFQKSSQPLRGCFFQSWSRSDGQLFANVCMPRFHKP